MWRFFRGQTICAAYYEFAETIQMVIGGDPGAVVKAAWTVAGLKPALTFGFQGNETFLPRSLTKNFKSSV